MSLLKYPYTNLHELNLDWIIEQLNQTGAVTSVNGKHGSVTLTGEDINRTPNNPQTVEQALSSQGSSLQSVQTKIGVTALPTTAQTITGAIAEHETDITNINNKIGSTALPTTAQTLTGAIAEHESDITSLNSQIASFSIRSINVPYTADASGQYNTNLYSLINADLPSGYTCLGIVGYSTSNQYVYFIGCYYANSAYSFQVKNTSAASVTENAIIKYLCAKLS